METPKRQGLDWTTFQTEPQPIHLRVSISPSKPRPSFLFSPAFFPFPSSKAVTLFFPTVRPQFLKIKFPFISQPTWPPSTPKPWPPPTLTPVPAQSLPRLEQGTPSITLNFFHTHQLTTATWSQVAEQRKEETCQCLTRKPLHCVANKLCGGLVVVCLSCMTLQGSNQPHVGSSSQSDRREQSSSRQFIQNQILIILIRKLKTQTMERGGGDPWRRLRVANLERGWIFKEIGKFLKTWRFLEWFGCLLVLAVVQIIY